MIFPRWEPKPWLPWPGRGLKCLAVEAGRTVILTPEHVRRVAADMGIALVGVRHCPSS